MRNHRMEEEGELLFYSVCGGGAAWVRHANQNHARRAAHLDSGLFDRPPPEGFPVVLGQPPPFP